MDLPKTLLVPTDFGEASERALAYAVALAKRLGADVVVLHAFEIPIVGFPDGAMVATAELTSRILEGAQSGLDRALARHKGDEVPMRAFVRQGDPWRSVLEAATEFSAEMIVMGTHGRRGLPRALIGSVAEKIVRTATVPVLTVHAGDAA
jgi:nucleotide-binding universal stress UspA family protein